MNRRIGVICDSNGARVIGMLMIVTVHVLLLVEARYSTTHPITDIFIRCCARPSLIVFMILAGMVHALGRTAPTTLSEYLKLLRAKGSRLMIPYATVSLLTLVLLMIPMPGATQRLGFGQVPFWLLAHVISTGAAEHLWFIYWLMLIVIIWPAFHGLATGRWAVALIVGLFLLSVLPLNWPTFGGRSVLGLEDLQAYLPYFVIGFVYGLRSRGAMRASWRMVLVAGSIFAAALLVEFRAGFAVETEGRLLAQNVIVVVRNLSGGFFYLWLLGLAASRLKTHRRLLAELSLQSYDVYILHLLAARAIVLVVSAQVRPSYTLGLVLVLPMALAIAVGIVLMTRVIRRRMPRTAFFFLGCPWPKTIVA